MNLKIRETSRYQVKEDENGNTVVDIVCSYVVDKFDFAQRIKLLSLCTNITLEQAALKFGTTSSSLNIKINTGKFTFNDKKRLADIFGCIFVAKYVFDNGVEFSGTNNEEMITNTLQYLGMNKNSFCNSNGMNRQAFVDKIRRGKLNDLELNEYAKMMGCEYVTYFELPDGSRI